MWGSTDLLFLEKLGWISYHHLFQTRKYMEEFYLNSQQCLKYPTPKSLGTLHQHVHSLIIFTHRTCLATANGQHHKIHLLSTVQKRMTSLLGRIQNHHFLMAERSLCKNRNQEITRVLEKSQAKLSSCALRGKTSCWGTMTGTMKSEQVFHPQVGLLLHDGIPCPGNSNCSELHKIHAHSPWHFHLFILIYWLHWLLPEPLFPVVTAASQIQCLSTREQF